MIELIKAIKAKLSKVLHLIENPSDRATVTTIATGVVTSVGLHLPSADIALVITGAGVLASWIARRA